MIDSGRDVEEKSAIHRYTGATTEERYTQIIDER